MIVIQEFETMAVATVSIKTTLEDVLECPICTDTYTDPRSLPCVHTFCLKCIREWNTDRIPGDEVSCPLCREKFTVPENGLDALPKNFFIAKLLLVKESQNEENQASLCTCEICSEVENNLRNKNLASMYCVDCEQKICKSCCAVHKNYKAFRNHRLVPLDEQTGAQELSSEYSPATCIRHADEQLKIYCLECKVVVCLMCYIEQHNSHKFSDINKMIDQLRQQMTADVDGLGKAAENLRRVLVDVNSEKEAYNRRVTEVENEICEQAKKLIAKIESDKQELLVQLAEEKNNRIKQVNQLHGDIEQHILLIEGLKKYGEKLTKDGTSSDISRESNVIRDRASELMKYDTLLLAKKKLGRADATFAPSKLLSGDNVNVTGRLRCSGSKG